jgi:hypothetical protein
MMGRSKAEQYLGFLPLFSYINFILGFLPLVIHDLWSQILFTLYILYILVLTWSVNLVNKLSLNFFYSLTSTDNRFKKNQNITYNTNRLQNKVHISSMAVNNFFLKNNLIKYSKSTSLLTLSLEKIKSYNLDYKVLSKFNFFLCMQGFSNQTTFNKNYRISRITSLSEVNYLGNTLSNCNFIKNYPITPYSIYRLNSLVKYPQFFDFNINNNSHSNTKRS